MKPLRLSADQVGRWADAFSDRGLWDDVLVLSQILWDQAEGSHEQWTAFHHLLMAVGNFKREGGRRIHAPRLRLRGGVPPSPSPGPHLRLQRDDFVDTLGPDDGPQLEHAVRGLGLVSATAVLSALWPSQHAIMDVRAHNAAIALSDSPSEWLAAFEISQGSHDEAPMDWRAYEHYRDALSQTAARTGCSLTPVERTLYLLDQKVVKTNPMAWVDYIDAVRRMSEGAP